MTATMNTTARSLVSTSLGLGLAAFTAIAAFAFGAAAPATLLGFGFLAAYGVLEIAVASYEPPHLVSGRRRPETASTAAKVIAYPSVKHIARAA